MSNPQIGDLEDVAFLRPSIKEHRDPETGELFDVTWMPTHMTANVVDPTTPEGYRPESREMRNQVVLPISRREARAYAEGHPCLTCSHWDHVKGQEEIRKQHLEETIQEAGIQMGYSGPNAIKVSDWGLCGLGASNGGNKATSPMAWCEQWKARKGGWKFAMRSKEHFARMKQTAGALIDKLTAPRSSANDSYKVIDRRGEK